MHKYPGTALSAEKKNATHDTRVGLLCDFAQQMLCSKLWRSYCNCMQRSFCVVGYNGHLNGFRRCIGMRGENGFKNDSVTSPNCIKRLFERRTARLECIKRQ